MLSKLPVSHCLYKQCICVIVSSMANKDMQELHSIQAVTVFSVKQLLCHSKCSPCHYGMTIELFVQVMPSNR